MAGYQFGLIDVAIILLIVGFAAILSVGVRYLTVGLSFSSIRSAPDLPIQFYASPFQCVLSTCFAIGALISGYHLAFSNVKLVAVLLLCFGAWLLFRVIETWRKHPVLLELSIRGIEANFMGLWRGERRLVPWQDIFGVELYAYPMGKAYIPMVKVTLKTNDVAYFSPMVGGTHKKELLAWLQEYLSRYGGGVKQHIQAAG